jgi:hypothetical protein
MAEGLHRFWYLRTEYLKEMERKRTEFPEDHLWEELLSLV